MYTKEFHLITIILMIMGHVLLYSTGLLNQPQLSYSRARSHVYSLYNNLRKRLLLYYCSLLGISEFANWFIFYLGLGP